jgi:L-lactate dehydrogenase complex protein LldG
MTTSIDDNRRAREAILERVRRALGKPGDDRNARDRALAVIEARAQGPRPHLPTDLVARFVERATDMASTVERLGSTSEIPPAVARYLDALQLPPAIAEQKSHRGVCWPELASLDWPGAGLAIEARPTFGGDRLGITGCLCAIAETGTLVVVSGAGTPIATTLLPDTHVAVVRERDVVSGMEEAMDRVRAVAPDMPRGIHLISGPSRTGDIEQTIVLGAHGPYRVHILLVP